MTSAQLEVGISIPQTFDRSVDTARILRFARRAESLGFDGLWTQEMVRGTPQALEPLTLLSSLAPSTRSARLGVAVLLATLWSPVALARVTATVDLLSGGRLVLGLGLGAKGNLEAAGTSETGRARRLEETVEVMRRLWSGEHVQFEGSSVRLEGWRLPVTPARPGGPPVWLGGSHPMALRRAVRIGDGWIGAGSTTAEDFAVQAQRIRDELADSGRDAASFAVGKRAYLAVGRREADGRRRLRDWFGRYHEHPEVADRVGLVGRPEVVAERLIGLRAAGARVLILNPLFAEEHQLAVLAADVVPMIREARV